MTITLNGTTGIVNTGSETINAQSEAIASLTARVVALEGK